jgi:hypothetical protein
MEFWQNSNNMVFELVTMFVLLWCCHNSPFLLRTAAQPAPNIIHFLIIPPPTTPFRWLHLYCALVVRVMILMGATCTKTTLYHCLQMFKDGQQQVFSLEVAKYDHASMFDIRVSWIGVPAQEFPPTFSLLKILALQKISGSDMARPRTQNLTSPIFDFPPPLNADHGCPKIGKTMGQFQY